MTIIENLTKFFEELTAQRMMIAENSADKLSETTEDHGPYDEGFVPIEADDIDEDWPYTDEDYASNMPCDFSGFCAGSNCPNFFKCKGSTK